MMKSRIVLLFVLLAASYGLITWVESGSGLAIAPNVDLSAFPQTIDGWVGEDIEIPDDTVQVMQADQYVNRVYRDAMGQEISMHVANWLNKVTISEAPHHPEICYPAAGWVIQERRTTQIKTAAGDIPMELISYQKGQKRVVSCHWFQVADVYFYSSSGFQRQRHRFWGMKAWPSTTKILLQTGAPTVDSAKERLEGFATLIANELAKGSD
ncbi:MAG: EpsI family protein [Planctomycetota bacterium]|nr:EpsI family protein [Planctomycetota bacterium]